MRIDFSTVLLDLKGNPLKERIKVAGQDTERDMTLSHASVEALMSLFPNEQNISGDERNKRGILAARLHDQEEVDEQGNRIRKIVDLKVDEVKLIKDLIGRAYPPLLVMRAYEILDPPPPPS